MKDIIKKLGENRPLDQREFAALLENRTRETAKTLQMMALETKRKWYGDDVYIRGLIEFTNHCKNDCYYCGIRRSNLNVRRYRLSDAEILDCCQNGYQLGFRTFVLQGGEDPYWNDERLAGLIFDIKHNFPDCAVTLSVGERPKESYRRLFNAGADRYLLRHETADCRHYSLLHPEEHSLQNRMRCLYDLKETGFQVGCGFMVGSPGQTSETLAKDLVFISDFQPHMVGIGPFIPHRDTPFAGQRPGTLELTLYLLSIIRLILPKVLLPATTALGTIHPQGREKGILAGANVVMPNLSPEKVRGDYSLYDNKLSTGEEAAENLRILREKMKSVGCNIAVSRGDSLIPVKH